MRCGAQGCGEEALTLSKFCWEHLADREEYSNTLFKDAENKKDLSGYNLRKVVLKKARFEKVLFKKADLSQATLSGAHFFDSDFEGADLIGTNLSDCDFTHCNFNNADLTKATLCGSRLWSTTLRNSNLSESDLSFVEFQSASLFNAKLWHAVLTGAKFLSSSNFSGKVGRSECCNINESGELSAMDVYRDLKRYFIANGMYNDASWASFKEKTMERIVLKKNGRFDYFPSMLMNILCGYGEKPYRIVLSAISAILLFALAYFSLDAVESTVAQNCVMKWPDYIYYSTITFTTVGYGDFIPKPHVLFRLLAAAEAFTGVFMTGLFVFTLARKYSAR